MACSSGRPCSARSIGSIPAIATSKVGFIGAGRVGRGLSLALSRAGVPIAGIADRKSALQVFADADIVFLTVPDDAIAAVAGGLPWNEAKSAVHCSGAAELSVLDAARNGGARVGGFHPLQMFADPEVAAQGLKGCSIAVEAEEPLAGVLLQMVSALGAQPLRVAPGARAAYHAAAHYAGPFIAALLAEAASIWGRLGIGEADALAALLPLARGSLDAIEHSGPARAMAGSVARGDVETLRRHVEALGALDPAFRDLYCELALRTVSLAVAAGKLEDATAMRVRDVLKG
jgi:predicted short-subunit dehydrogenase-like oxidoreductase (DUF2520 family)